MSARPWGKFFWADWESDEALRQCSLAAQGLWMRMLCICAKGDPYGYVSIAGVALDAAGLSTAVGRPEAEVAPLLAELDRWGVFSRDRKGRLYSRRMLRDEQRAKIGRKHALRQWSQTTDNEGQKPLPIGAPIGRPSTHKPDAREGSLGKRQNPNKKHLSPSGRAPPGAVIDFEFAEFWRVFPRRDDRGHAIKAYRTARKKANQETIVEAAKRYGATRRGQDPQFTALAATWLNGERWADEPPPRNGGIMPNEGVF